MEYTRIIGIDPGLSGGIAVISRASPDDHLWDARAIPTPVRFIYGPPRPRAKRKKYHDYDIEAIHCYLKGVRDAASKSGGKTYLVIEKIVEMPNKGADSSIKGRIPWSANGMSKLQKGYGVLRGVAGCVFPLEDIFESYPTQWQTYLFGAPGSDKRPKGSDTKALSVGLCRLHYPNTSLLKTPKSKAPDDGMADAISLAEYGRRRLYAAKG